MWFGVSGLATCAALFRERRVEIFGVGFRVKNLGVRIEVSGFGVEVSGLATCAALFRERRVERASYVQRLCPCLMVSELGCRVWGWVCRVKGVWCRV